MKLKINRNNENEKILNGDNDIEINNTDDFRVSLVYKGKDCLQVWVDGQIIYIYPKTNEEGSTTVSFMDRVICNEEV